MSRIFKIGDKVRVKSDDLFNNKVGIITDIYPSNRIHYYCVEFKEKISGSNGSFGFESREIFEYIIKDCPEYLRVK